MSKESWVNNETNRLSRRYDGVPFRDSQRIMVAKMLWEQKGKLLLEDLEQVAMFTAWSLSHKHDWRKSTRMKMKELVQEEKLINRMGAVNDEFYKPKNSSDRPVEDEVEDRLAIKQLTSILTDKQKKVIDGLFFEGKILDDLADEMGVTRERVRQIEAKALRRMKNYARRSGWIEPNRRSEFQTEYTPTGNLNEDAEPTINNGVHNENDPKRQPEGGFYAEVKNNQEKVIKWDEDGFITWLMENAGYFRERGEYMLTREQMPEEISIGSGHRYQIEILTQMAAATRNPVGMLAGRKDRRWMFTKEKPTGIGMEKLRQEINNLDFDQNPVMGSIGFPPEERNKSWWRKIWDGPYQETHIPLIVYENLTVKIREIIPESLLGEVQEVKNRTFPTWLITGPERIILVAGVRETRKFKYTYESGRRRTPAKDILMKAITATWEENYWEHRDGRWQHDLRIVPKLGLIMYVADPDLTKFVKWQEPAEKKI